MTQSEIMLHLGMMNQAMRLIVGGTMQSDFYISADKFRGWLGVTNPEAMSRSWNTYLAPLLDDLGPLADMCQDNLLREFLSGKDAQAMALEIRKALRRAAL